RSPAHGRCRRPAAARSAPRSGPGRRRPRAGGASLRRAADGCRHRGALQFVDRRRPGDPGMNLALVIEDLDPARGGAEVFSARLGRWLLQAGHGVTVLAARWDPALERDYRACSARARFERIPRCVGPRALGTFAFARGAASRIAALKQAGAVDLSLDM